MFVLYRNDKDDGNDKKTEKSIDILNLKKHEKIALKCQLIIFP